MFIHVLYTQQLLGSGKCEGAFNCFHILNLDLAMYRETANRFIR